MSAARSQQAACRLVRQAQQAPCRMLHLVGVADAVDFVDVAKRELSQQALQ